MYLLLKRKSVVAQLSVLFLLTLEVVATAHGQSKWQNVAALPLGTKVHVSADTGGGGCKIEKVTEDALVCGHGRTFARTAIKTIKLTRRGVSTLGGVAIGAGAGLAAGIGAAHGNQGSFNIVSNQDVWGAGAAVGGVLGGAIGAASDFLRGPTVYRR
jgi:hypothetical protein